MKKPEPPPPDPFQLGVHPPGRVPPSDLDAEGFVLSWAIVTEGDIDRAHAVGLKPEHFYPSANQHIWESILRLSVEAGMHVDIVSVAGDLRSLGRLDQIGGTPYLAQLVDQMPVEPKEGVLEQHCRSIINCWTARQVQSVSHVTIANLYQPQGVPLHAIIEAHETKIWDLAHQHRETVYETAGIIAHEALTDLAAALRDGGHVGLSTGFDDLDKKTGGYQEGHLIVIAARTGMGKSAALTSSLIRSTRVPKDGSLPTAAYIHSLEMPKEEVSLRLVCIEASIEYQKMRLGQLNQFEWTKLFEAAKRLAQQPLLIGDKPGLTVQELRSIVRKIKREIERGIIKAKKLAAAAVDYLQLMTGDKTGNRELEVSSITRNLKGLAKTEKLCMIALSQVNRAPEKKVTDKRPTLADLRESGAIENDSDGIWFIYRDKYYNSSSNDDAEIIIAKQRGGATGTVMLAFDGPTISFKPLAKGYEEFNDFGDEAETHVPQLPPPDDDAWYNR